MTHWAYQNRASAILFDFLKSLPSDIVFLVPANSCPIVLATFLKAAIKFELIDIDKNNYLINVDGVKKIIARTACPVGLLYIRTLGFLDDQSSLFDTLKTLSPTLTIVDDRCLCGPVFDKQQYYASADLTLFSTGYSKVAELGRDGFGYFSNKHTRPLHSATLNFSSQIHDQLIQQFNTSISSKTRFTYRDSDWLDNGMPEITFEEYQIKITKMYDEAAIHKQKINTIYRRSLEGNSNITLLDDAYQQWRFNIAVSNNEAVIDSIFRENLFASSHYASMAGIFDDQQAPEAERLHSRIVNLFNDYRVSENDAKKLSDIVNAVAN